MINTGWFKGLESVADIKAHYRKLAMQHHPDLGGDEETMKQINNDYELALRGCDGQVSKDSEGKEHTYRYRYEEEKEIMDKIDELIKMHLDPNKVSISLIGCWLWVTGDTKPHKEQFKASGLRWHSKRKCWYYKPSSYKFHHSYSGKSLEHLAWQYGCENVDLKEKENKKARRKELVN